MISVVGFLSRSHGYAVLEELIKNENIVIQKIFTHSLNPLSQDSTRSVRDDFFFYKTRASQIFTLPTFLLVNFKIILKSTF